VFLDLDEERCVLLGGGRIAGAKLGQLLESGAEVTVIADGAVELIREAAEAGLVRWLRRGYRQGDLSGARLVIDATDDPDTNRQAREEATRERALLNVVDRAPLCDWIAPAVVNRGPLKVAVSTAGESPFLASAIRRRLETVLGEEWGPFVTLVGALRRQLRARGLPLPEQERIYRRAIRSEARRLLREGREAEARAAIEHLASPSRTEEWGRVTVAGAGPGSMDLLTGAVRDVLYEADVVFHDALVEPEVLALCGPATRTVNVGKRAGEAGVAQREINRLLIEAARGGQEVIRLKGGDPFIFGRGGEEVAALIQAGVPVRVLPGVSSATAAPALAGIPLTMRDVASSVAFCTAQLKDGPARLRGLAGSADTLVILMARGRAEAVARELAEVLGDARPAAIVASASTGREGVLLSTLGGIAAGTGAGGLDPPALLVVGEVVAVAARQACTQLVG
jgi:uroporphyrin-III C-methyltransferase/precorrin-2 dehydrogenase/sirohydrochlorin ferrochelatase